MAQTQLDPYAEFCGLCRAGKLFAVEEWIRARGLPEPPTGRRRATPISIAIEKGFHSLVEVLLRGGVRADANALWLAVLSRRVDFVELMLAHGADINCLSLSQIIKVSDIEVVRLFVERGANLTEQYPIAAGLLKAPKPFLGIVKEKLATHPELQLQLNIALRRYVDKKSERGVALMLWAGANPRARVPGEWGEDEEDWCTAIDEAALNGDLPMLKRLRVSVNDDLNHLLQRACFRHNTEMIEFLVGMGGDLNHVGQDGESCWSHLACNLDSATNPRRDWSWWCGKSDAIACIQTAVRLGIKLKKLERRSKAEFRSGLARLSWMEVLDLAKLFLAHNAGTPDEIADVINTPKLKMHLAPCRHKIATLLPRLRRWSERKDQ